MADFTTEDVTYRTGAGQALLARLYRPAQCAGALLVEVHGGAWTGNDRTTNAAIHTHLAANGIAVFAIDFRLAPAHKYPAALEDTCYAIRWLKANAARLGLQPRRIGGVATSSGAQQLVAVALSPEKYSVKERGLETTSELDFVVACWPILDPLARYRMARAKNLERLVNNHHAFWPDEAAMADGNPYLMLERGEATAKPPMLILQGTADNNVEHERADLFAALYRKAGGEVELVKYEGQPHTFIPNAPASAASQAALAKMTAFIDYAAAASRPAFDAAASRPSTM